jgi:hypothetical protein
MMNDVAIQQRTFAAEKACWGEMEIDADGYFWLDLDLLPESQSGGLMLPTVYAITPAVPGLRYPH